MVFLTCFTNQRAAHKRRRLKELCRGNYFPSPNSRGSIQAVLDVQATGADFQKDEILQVSLINIDSQEILFDSFIKPFYTKDWEATKVHHIMPEMVQDAPYIYEILPEINKILSQTELLISYNSIFDRNFLLQFGAIFRGDMKIIDLQEHFSSICGKYLSPYGEYQDIKDIRPCADYFGYSENGAESPCHLYACKAAAFVYQAIKERAAKKALLFSLCREREMPSADEGKGSKRIIFSLRTTGTDPAENELLEIALMDLDSNGVLFHQVIQPYFTTNWERAEASRHITPESVKNAPYIFEVLPELNKLFSQAGELIGCHTAYACAFLQRYGIQINSSVKLLDITELLPPTHGLPPWSIGREPENLALYAGHLGYHEQSFPCDALWDCRAMIFCYLQLSKTAPI